MNVCLLNDSFPPLIDGVGNAVLNYATHIQNKYGNASVIVPKYPNVTDDYPFEVIRYPSIDTTKIVGYRAGLPFSNVIYKRTDAVVPDIIHSHCPAVSTLVARTLRETADAPIVFTYHTKFDVDIAKAIKGEVFQKAATDIFVSNIASADEVWTVSRGAGENLRKLGYQGDYIIMKNGVDFPKGRIPDAEVDALAKSYGIKRDAPIFLFVGRMMWYKGCKIALDGLAMAKAKGYDFTMIFIGEGADFDEIKQYSDSLGLEKECIFTGPIRDRYLLRTFFCLADLFLFPSTFDTNGIVVREAAACSLGSVLIKDSCAAEDITDGVNGILTDETAEGICNAIENACKNRAYLKAIGENACRDLFCSWEEAVDAAVERYAVVIENYKRDPHPRRADVSDELFAVIARSYENIQNFKNGYKKLAGKAEELIRNITDSSDNTDKLL